MYFFYCVSSTTNGRVMQKGLGTTQLKNTGTYFSTAILLQILPIAK